MPKLNQENSRQPVQQTAISLLGVTAPNPKEPEVFVPKKIQMKDIKNNSRDNNRQRPNRQNWTPNRPKSIRNSSKGQCKHCKGKNHASNEREACFKCGKIGRFRNEGRNNTPND